jgi:hypothetical protein
MAGHLCFPEGRRKMAEISISKSAPRNFFAGRVTHPKNGDSSHFEERLLTSGQKCARPGALPRIKIKIKINPALNPLSVSFTPLLSSL